MCVSAAPLIITIIISIIIITIIIIIIIIIIALVTRRPAFSCGCGSPSERTPTTTVDGGPGIHVEAGARCSSRHGPTKLLIGLGKVQSPGFSRWRTLLYG